MSVDTTEIKVGDKIRLRNGDVKTVTDIITYTQGCPAYPVGVCWGSGEVEYTRDGLYWEDDEDPRDILEIIPASEEKIDTKVNLDDLKVGDTIEFADGTTATVTDVDASDDGEHEYVVSYRTEYDNDYWYYHKDGTGEGLLSGEVIVAIIPAGITSEEPSSEIKGRKVDCIISDDPDKVPQDDVVVKNGLTLTEVLTYGTVGQVYGRRIDGVLQDFIHHITLYSCSMGEKIGFGMKEDVACSLEDIEASDWEFVGYDASVAAAKLAE